MAWTAPMTAVANAVFTAAQYNAHVRDNLLETAPAKATAAGNYFVATGVNAIAERVISTSRVNTSQTTASTSYTDLATAGPAVTVTTGTRAMVWTNCQLQNSVDSAGTHASVTVSGASSIGASDAAAISLDGVLAANPWRLGTCYMFDTLTAGSNTFTMKYRVSAGTGTFHRRHIIVMPL